ncbi:phage tail tape measure protein [Pseudomonas sp. BW13M1]|uniref:Phage tail tape measure protein n=1 Tax=Pseudomonas peradeniyensis TaxID=2745488 RepID=A0A923GD14_9PSED|nr:phage tail tape measure protein [Pseudomonas peradeniyensis]MBV4505658.1 phage tail tape measure protein [Pseudomonas peradeniyensis]
MSANNATSRLDFILSLTDKVTAPLAKVSQGINVLAKRSQASIEQITAATNELKGSAGGIGALLQPALEMNRALADVRSLGVADDALDALNRKALKFSMTYGESARSFVTSAYKIEGAIKGLSGSQLATFTHTSSVLAKATKTDQGVMAEYVGTMYNLQKQQADAMGKGLWVKQLGGQTALAVQLFRTSGEQIKAGFKEAGASASAAGIGLAEQMAVIGSLSSTMQGGEAGSLYKAFFDNIDKASKKLGISFTDTDGKALPMLDILAKLEGRFGDLKGAAANTKLTQAFGDKGAQLIGALAQDTDRFRSSLDKLGKVRGLEEAEKMAKAMVDPWQQFTRAVEGLRIAFGQALIPILQPLMNRLVEIGTTLVRWISLFPNITRLVGYATLVIFGLSAAMGVLTILAGIHRMTLLRLNAVWALLNMTGLKSIFMFLRHALVLSIFLASLIAMYAWMGIVRVATLAWQGALWLVNAALLANPIILIIAGIIALVAAVVLVIAYWDELKAAFLDSAAFQWVSAQLDALSKWFTDMGGWTGMAKAAWDGIVKVFRSSLDLVIEWLNKIPGVNIETSFADLPEAPKVPGLASQVAPIGVLPMSNTQPLLKTLMQVPSAAPHTASMAPATVAPSMASAPVEQLEQQRQRMTQTALNLSPASPTSVPQGGLMTQIQNTTQAQDRRMHVEKVEINTSKAMNPLELEQMMAMAVG